MRTDKNLVVFWFNLMGDKKISCSTQKIRPIFEKTLGTIIILAFVLLIAPTNTDQTTRLPKISVNTEKIGPLRKISLESKDNCPCKEKVARLQLARIISPETEKCSTEGKKISTESEQS